MSKSKTPLAFRFRVVHRYLGFFLAGIMAVYAISGILMVFRNTDFLKSEVLIEKQLEPNLKAEQLGPLLQSKIKEAKVEGDLVIFKGGNYNINSGQAEMRKMELPFLLDKMEHMHKATTDSPLYLLNIFFGVSLLFFVFSAFWMYTPKMPIFKKGIYFALAGMALTLIMLLV
jgi:uncharacterized iron-regulated membrane protein